VQALAARRLRPAVKTLVSQMVTEQQRRSSSRDRHTPPPCLFEAAERSRASQPPRLLRHARFPQDQPFPSGASRFEAVPKEPLRE
jgi:hypothetical protein